MEDVGAGTYNLYLRGKYVSAVHIRLSRENVALAVSPQKALKGWLNLGKS